MFPNIKIVEAIRKEYPAGTRIRLVKMDKKDIPELLLSVDDEADYVDAYKIAQWDTRYGETAGKSNVNCEER